MHLTGNIESGSSESEGRAANRTGWATRRRRRAWLGYGIAVTLTPALLVARISLGRKLGDNPAIILFMLPIMLSAYLGGLGPGLLSTVLAAVGSYFVLLSSDFLSIQGRWLHPLQWLSLIVSGGAVSILCEGFHRQIAERRGTEEKLRSSQGRLGAIFDSAMDGIVSVDEQQQISFFNPAAEKMFKTSAIEAVGQPLERFIPERYRSTHGKHIHAFGQAHTTRRTMGQLGLVYGLRSDGEEFPLEASISHAQVAGRNLFTVILRDVTERQRAESDVQQQAALLDQTYDALFVWELNGAITFWNRGAEALYGYPRAEALGHSSHRLLQTKALDGIEGFRQALARDGQWEGELQHRTRDGRWILGDSRMVMIRRPQGPSVLEIVRDVTERKRAEEALLESERAFRTLAELVPQLVWMCTPDGLNVYFNQRWVDYTGLALEESYGRGWNTPFHPDDKQPAWNAWNHAVATGDTYNIDVRLRRGDGTYRWFLTRGVPLRDATGNIVKWFGTCTDIDDLKRAEKEIRELNASLEQRVVTRTAELEAANKELEAFTYSVSHDLRAPLRHVDGFSKLLVEKHAAALSPDAQDCVATIRDAAVHMGLLIDDLLNLARVGRKQLSMEVTGLNSLVEEVKSDLTRANHDRVIEWKVDTLPFVECDPALMKQVFANLLANAVKFTRPRKPALIEVGVTDHDGARAVFVRDNGVGFSMKYAHKLFGVFQRLHRSEDFEGTGVGLATVQRIIHKHGGKVWAEAALDKGASFYFTLGASDEPVAI